jgi:hypothetical protein
MGHRWARWAPRPSAVHGLPRTTLGLPHNDHAPARTRLDWEARLPSPWPPAAHDTAARSGVRRTQHACWRRA